MLAELAPVGPLEEMLAQRIVGPHAVRAVFQDARPAGRVELASCP
jgi:hypothetical protein